MDDTELLHVYATDEAEAAFRTLVERHVPLVYSAALRQVRNVSLAEDVTQVVFILLARKAGQIPQKTILTGWLYRTTCHIAAKALRAEGRRGRREQEALRMQIPESTTRWEELAPFLDDAMAQLSGKDRDALLLRYFRNRSLREVGLALGLSEDAAQKRVSRAIGKLRQLLLRRGVAVSIVAVIGLLPTHAAQLAPEYLSVSVTMAALSKAALSTPVYALLLHQVLRKPIWPKVLAKACGALALVAASGLVIHFWPARVRTASGVSFEAKLARHSWPAAQIEPETTDAPTVVAARTTDPQAAPVRVEPVPPFWAAMAGSFPPLTSAAPDTNVLSPTGLPVYAGTRQGASTVGLASDQTPAQDYPAWQGFSGYPHGDVMNQVIFPMPFAVTNRVPWLPAQNRVVQTRGVVKGAPTRRR